MSPASRRAEPGAGTLSTRPHGILRVATYNLLHGISVRTGALDFVAAAEAVAALDADVVAVQEVDRGLPRTGHVDQVAELAQRTGLHGVFGPALLGNPDSRWQGVDGDDPGGPAYGVGLLTSQPLSDVERVALPGGGDGERQPNASPQNPGWDNEPRVVLCGVLEVGGVAVQIATAHLSYLPWRGLAQLRAAAGVAGAGGGPAVLIGDFNLPVWPVRMALPGWTHGGGQPTYPSWDPRLQVDQIIVRGGVRVAEVGVGPAATSDHLPLLAALELPERP